MKSINVAITGGNGFLGSNLAKKLAEENIKFVVLDRSKCDLLNPQTLREFVEGKDVVVHAAGLNIGEFKDVLKVNVLGTASILEAISLYNPKTKFIFISSVQAYLDDNKYGLSKKMGEELFQFFVRKNQLNGFILRFTNLYGPGCKPFYNSALTTFIYQTLRGEEITVNGDGSQTRDYLFISDAVDAILKSIKKEIKGVEILDVCTEKKYSIKQILGELKNYAKNIKIRYNTNYVSDNWIFPLFYKKTKKILDWEPKISFKEGLEKTVNFYK